MTEINEYNDGPYRAIYTTEGGPYKCIVYGKKKDCQIHLPKNFYSRGYWERVTEGNWEELSYLPNDIINNLNIPAKTEQEYIDNNYTLPKHY